MQAVHQGIAEVAVTIGDDREPTGVRRGEVSTGTARKIIAMMEEEKDANRPEDDLPSDRSYLRPR